MNKDELKANIMSLSKDKELAGQLADSMFKAGQENLLRKGSSKLSPSKDELPNCKGIEIFDGWKSDSGIKWFSEGYLDSKIIIAKSEERNRILKIIDETDKENGWEESPVTKHRAILVLTLKERIKQLEGL